MDFLTIRQYAFVVRLDIKHFCSSFLSTNILGIGIKNSERTHMKKYNKKTSLFRDKKTVILMYIALVYLFIVLDITLIDRSVGQRRKMLEPFWEISQFLETKQYTYWLIQIFGNIFLLLPFGFVLPVIFEKFRSFRLTTGVCLGFSLFIELTQYVTGRGLLELDDIMHNTVGGAMGFIIYEKIAEYRGIKYL